MQIERQAFYKPEEILRDVEEQIEKAKNVKESIDYLTFVPDGEPTLDLHLGEEIKRLKKLGVKAAYQTLFQPPPDLSGQEQPRSGFGEGGFVVLKARKK